MESSDTSRSDTIACSPATPQKRQVKHEKEERTHSPGREDALMIAGARARQQQQGAAASRARRAGRRREREAASLRSEMSLGESDDKIEPKSWADYLCCCCLYCYRHCCPSAAQKTDWVHKSHMHSYDLAPPQESRSRGDAKRQHKVLVENTAKHDTDTARSEEQGRLLVPLDNSVEIDAADGTSKLQREVDLSATSIGSTHEVEKSPRTMPIVDDDLHCNTSSVSTPVTPQLPSPGDNCHPDSPPEGLPNRLALHGNTTDQQVLAGSGSTLEEDRFPAQSRWLRAVKKAEAMAARMQGGADTDGHWKLSPDSEDFVPREYAEENSKEDEDLHPSQRRIVVSIRSRSLSGNLERSNADENSRGDGRTQESPSAADLVGAREARASDR